mgnify:CR=1 FL=1
MMKRTAVRVVPAIALFALGVATFVPHLKGQNTGQPSTKNGEWPMYTADLRGSKYSPLDQIDKNNFGQLQVAWRLKTNNLGPIPDRLYSATPLVVDGVMYLTERPNDVMAVDAKTGRVFWLYRYTPSPDARVCCGANNRGVAMLGNTLYMGTLDAHLVAIDAKTGRAVWNVAVGDPKLGYSVTMAPGFFSIVLSKSAA